MKSRPSREDRGQQEGSWKGAERSERASGASACVTGPGPCRSHCRSSIPPHISKLGGSSFFTQTTIMSQDDEWSTNFRDEPAYVAYDSENEDDALGVLQARKESDEVLERRGYVRRCSRNISLTASYMRRFVCSLPFAARTRHIDS